MRTYIIITLFCILTFAKCKKDDIGGQYYGYAKATVNNSIVNYNKCAGSLLMNNPDSLGFSFERWEGLIAKEKISFLKVGNITTPQRLYKRNFAITQTQLTSRYITLTADGDVMCDAYDIYEPDSLQNFITITSFNPLTKEIRGIFQATYLIDSSRVASIGKCKPNAPDTLRIRNGEFYTKIF